MSKWILLLLFSFHSFAGFQDLPGMGKYHSGIFKKIRLYFRELGAHSTIVPISDRCQRYQVGDHGGDTGEVIDLCVYSRAAGEDIQDSLVISKNGLDIFKIVQVRSKDGGASKKNELFDFIFNNKGSHSRLEVWPYEIEVMVNKDESSHRMSAQMPINNFKTIYNTYFGEGVQRRVYTLECQSCHGVSSIMVIERNGQRRYFSDNQPDEVTPRYFSLLIGEMVSLPIRQISGYLFQQLQSENSLPKYPGF